MDPLGNFERGCICWIRGHLTVPGGCSRYFFPDEGGVADDAVANPAALVGRAVLEESSGGPVRPAYGDRSLERLRTSVQCPVSDLVGVLAVLTGVVPCPDSEVLKGLVQNRVTFAQPRHTVKNVEGQLKAVYAV